MRRIVLLLAAGLTACAAPVDLGQTAWQADLTGGPGGITGSVAAVAVSDRTTVSIAIQRALSGQQYAWRIQLGDCQAEGATLGGAATYPSLLPDQSGGAEAEALLSQALRTGPYAARVFQVQAGGAQTLAACGVLQRTH